MVVTLSYLSSSFSPESVAHFLDDARTRDATSGRVRSRDDKTLPTRRTAAAGGADPGRKEPKVSRDTRRLPSSCWDHRGEALGLPSTLFG